MDQFSKYLKSEATKYSDLINILEKLESNGSLTQLYALIGKIFTEEATFTLSELKKLSDPSMQKFNIENQYKKNTNIFKLNFSLIISMLLDCVYEGISTVSKLQSNDIEDYATTLPERADILNGVKSGPKLVGKSLVLEDAYSTKMKSPSNNNNQFGNKKGQQNAKTFTITNPDRIYSPNSSPKSNMKILTNKNGNNNNNILGSSSKTQNTSISQLHQAIKNVACLNPGNPAYQSNPTMLSTKSGNQSQFNSSSNLSTSKQKISMNSSRVIDSGVHSEFNYIVGAGSFSTTKRSLDVSPTITPGPSSYQLERSELFNSKSKRFPSPTIGKAKKQTWIDIATKTDSPGVGMLYPSLHFVNK